MGRSCSTDENRNVYRIFVGHLEGKRPQRRPRRRWGVILKWIIERYYREV
jgi:hypothetical protein